ncbi:DUF4476 domain-containing protein [candidate division WOR-3 bacterium]|nr:DUF4476 domain-containing protein [candidate division WOR-3 bacterium]
MNLKAAFILVVFLGGPLAANDNSKALLREISHLEESADVLMKLMLEVQNRELRRKITERIDEFYEAAERMRKLIVEDSIPESIRTEDLDKFLAALEGAGFSDAKVAMIEEFARSNWFTVDQIGEIVDKVPFGGDMVEAIVSMYPHIVDPENTYKLYEHVTFSDDRELLKERLQALEQDSIPRGH